MIRPRPVPAIMSILMRRLASLRKWPSLNNQRSPQAPGPYLVLDGTLDECLREFMAKPAGSRHLYEIHTQAQPPLVQASLDRRDRARGRAAAGFL